jgi:hypothetical protein
MRSRKKKKTKKKKKDLMRCLREVEHHISKLPKAEKTA